MFVCRPEATKRVAKTTGLDTTRLYSVLTSGTKAKKSNVRVSMNKYLIMLFEYHVVTGPNYGFWYHFKYISNFVR